ncbi:MAG: pyridoxal phosphate-dependent aminotransferase [Nitrospirae bacterium]|nr:pyridoxal phosphate-dependent aminotransferase [Nitrospirota bacterium]
MPTQPVLSKRAAVLKPSPTLAISARARELRAQGHDVVNFGAGEPDFDTPPHIKDAAVAAIRSGFTKYTAVAGIDDLKDAIRARLKADYGLDYARDEVVVSCGAKHSLYNLFVSVLDPDDEVIIPAPYWVSYPEMVALAGGKPVIVNTSEERGYRLSPDDLAAAATPRTKALILNDPSNPTGATYTRDDLARLAEVAKAKDFWVVSDEIYDKLVYEGEVHTAFPTLSADARRRTLLVNGVSKTYAMTGWRIGYVAGDRDVLRAAAAVQGQVTSNPTSIAQKAALEALKGDQKPAAEMAGAFNERRRYMHGRLTKMAGVRCYESRGAFYLFPNVSSHYGRKVNGQTIKSSTDLTRYLLDEAKVAVVPGGEFGDDRCIRLSYAVSLEEIKKGLDRIEASLGRLK